MNKIKGFVIFTILVLIALTGCAPEEKEITYGDYHQLEVNLLHVDGGLYWLINSNTATLGDEFDRQNQLPEDERDLTVELKETDEGRVIHQFDGLENNDKHRWSIYSDSCDDGVCSNDVDSIVLDEDLELTIVYEDR